MVSLSLSALVPVSCVPRLAPFSSCSSYCSDHGSVRPLNSNHTSTMSQPATAAIIVASIFGGLAALFFGYKAYRKVWTWRHQNLLLPPVRASPAAYHGTNNMSTVPDPSGLASLANANSKRSSYFASSPAVSTAVWPHTLPSNTSSERASPSIGALDSVVVSSPAESYDPRMRTMSSSSSTMTLTRAYHKSSSASQLSFSTPSRRESYLPHSPLNRDTIQIVPPQPLGFGGTMAMAADQRTLAFSKSSGIGLGEDFGSGLVWTQSDTRPRTAPRAHLPDQDRKRYLMQGPSSSLRDSDKSSLQSFTAPSQSPSQVSSLRMDSGSQSPVDSRPMTLSTSASTMQSSEAPSTGPIDSKTLDAEHSPLQRLQSRASATTPHTRSVSAANSLSAGSHESPILSPFAPPLSSPFVPSSEPTTTSSPIQG